MKKAFAFISLFFCFICLAEPLPISDFTKHGDYLNMELSPDGKHILARARAEDRVIILFLDSATMKVIGGIKPPAGDAIHSAQWINNERVVYQIAEKQLSIDQQFSTGELFATNIDGSRRSMLFGYRAGDAKIGTRFSNKKDTLAAAEVISLLDGQEKYILIAEYPFTVEGNTLYNNRERQPQISRLNVYTGKKKKIENIPFRNATVFATSAGEVKFVRWRDDKNTIHTSYRTDEKADWTELEGIGIPDYVPIALNKLGTRFYFYGDLDERELNTIYELNLETNEVKALFNTISSDVESINWDPELDAPVVGITETKTVEYHYAPIKNQTSELHKALVYSFEGKRLSIESQSDDGKMLLLHVSSDVNPGEYYLFDTQTNNAQFLWANRSWLDPRVLAPKKPISFKSSDGLTVSGYLTLPINSDNKSFPLIVMNHGGPHGSRDDWSFDAETQLFANNGYAVLQVNFRGSGGYGDKFEAAGYREWGGKMIDDIIEGTQFALENYPLDASKVCVYGASYGGYASMMATIKAPDLYKCTIGYVGVYDLNYMYSRSDIGERESGIAYLNRVIGNDKETLFNNSPVNLADKVNSNVLLIHGNKDERVDILNSKKMEEALIKADKPVEFINFSQAGHGVYDEEERKKLYTKILDFLNTNLK